LRHGSSQSALRDRSRCLMTTEPNFPAEQYAEDRAPVDERASRCDRCHVHLRPPHIGPSATGIGRAREGPLLDPAETRDRVIVMLRLSSRPERGPKRGYVYTI
jgi:hypothetical protein